MRPLVLGALIALALEANLLAWDIVQTAAPHIWNFVTGVMLPLSLWAVPLAGLLTALRPKEATNA